MGTHKKLTEADPFEDSAYWELAKTYLKMGLWEEALAQFRILAQHYNSSGMEEKALKVMGLMARIDSSKPGSGKQITGLKHPMKLKDRGAVNARSEEAAIREAPINEKGKGGYFDLGAELETVKSGQTRDQQPIGGGENLRKPTPISSTRSMDPDFDCNPAVEPLEGGRIDDAVEQFQSAYEKKQNVFESSHSLGLGFKKKSQREGAHPALTKASRVDGISREKILAAKFEMGLILKEQGNMEEALDLLGEAIIGRSGISQYQISNQQADTKIIEGGKTPAYYFTEFDRKSQAEKGLGPGKNNQKNSKDRREYYCFYLLCSVLLLLLQNQFCFNN
jgi:tetratricopeptide (TPR) repeat protein